uniref:F-box domain-containing protein n=1 Tax=Marseillevirus LCMAC102 TaxID=2506603 RepID=A0A481YT13_9VIRU|nr:MAG: hypothetical protein LCMAC102_01630 [Marseillevirus LCMAC102]
MFHSIPIDVLKTNICCFLNIYDLNSLGLVSTFCLGVTTKHKKQFRAAWRIYKFWRLHRWKRIDHFSDLYVSKLPIRVIDYEGYIITGFIRGREIGSGVIILSRAGYYIHTIWANDFQTQPRKIDVEIPKRYLQDEEL